MIPTFNRPYKTKTAVQSVLEQTKAVDEIIVVDDGSTGESIDFKHPCVRVVRTTQNRGVSAARNLGIRLAQSEWIGLLDSDDTWKPSKWKNQLAALKTDKTILFSHTNETWIRDGKFVNKMKKHQKFGGWIYEKCLPLCAMSPSSVVMHTSLIQDIGTFDETLPACEDYDYWLRVTSRYPVHYLNSEEITKTGGHSDQLSKKHWGMDRFRIVALEKQLKNKKLIPKHQKKTLEVLLKKLSVLENGARKRGSLQHEFFREKRQHWSSTNQDSRMEHLRQ